MSQTNIPPAPERLPNEPYYNQPEARPDQRRRWGRLLLIVGLVWLGLTVVGNGPWFGGFPFGPGRTVDRDLGGSSLAINAQSDDIVLGRSADRQFHVRATVRGWGWGGEPDDVLRRAGVEIRSDDGVVRVVAPSRGFQFGNLGVELHVDVPQGAPVTIETVSGDVTASALDGAVAVTTVSGDVRLSETAGALTITTTSGDVQLRDGRASGATVKTSSGDVDLRGVAGPTSVNTLSGDIAVRDAADVTLGLQSTSGDVRFDGTLASGGASVLKSTSGDLNVRVANPALDMTHDTVSGDIDIEVEQQASAPKLQLNTTSGDIQVKPID
jgi:hypothetical protein